MEFNQLSLEQQQVLLDMMERNNIEQTEENLNEVAKIYDQTIQEAYITPVSSATISAEIKAFQTSIARTRNEIIQFMLEDALRKVEEYGENLVKINYNTIASPLCEHRQNRIYWVNQPEGNYSELDPELWSNGGGLFHPNCRHNMSVYFEGYSSEPVDDPITNSQRDELYKAQQELNYVKRNKSKYYERKELARITGNSSYEHNKNLWKEWTAREQALNNKYGNLRA